MQNEIIQNRIKNYLLGKMSAEDAHTFRLEIEKDASLKKLVMDQQDAQEVLELSIENDLRSKMNAWSEEKPRQSKRVTMPLWRTTLARAATLVLLVTAGYFLWPSGNLQQSLDMYQLYTATATRSTANDVSAAKPEVLLTREAYVLLEDKQYDAALDKINEILAFVEDPADVNYQQAEWNKLVILYAQDADSEAFNQLYEQIAADPVHIGHDRLDQFKK